jgi:hypothetical protein
VIEQYPITATPKYNFPHPDIDTTLPHQFTASSLRSLQSGQNGVFQLNQQIAHQFSNLEEAFVPRVRLQPIPLKPAHQASVVAAVDTSTIKIGETNTGVLIGVRGANVWKQDGSYRYTRIGPFIFHLTEENKKQVYETLEKAYFNSHDGNNQQGGPNFLQMPTRIAGLLERWLQAVLSKTMHRGLILFDGSLTAGTPETPAHRLREILNAARKEGNVVLAISKMTSLRVNGHLITDYLPSHKPPCLLETDGLKLKPPMVLLGEVYIARLDSGKLAFRLDIDREVQPKQHVEAVEKLMGNDIVSQGYPETLRLAHIFCTFTANEVLAMQHFVARRFGLQIINRVDMHKLLFGPFGKGEKCS